jgi:hypothetical protein
MLKVKIVYDRLGFGVEEQIGSFNIINTGKNENRPEYGDYLIERLDAQDVVICTGSVLNHKRSEGVWPLLLKSVESVQDVE